MKSAGPLKRAIAGFLGLDYNQITIHAFGRFIELQRNPAIAHLKGPADFMPYCGNALLPYAIILKRTKNRYNHQEHC